MVPEPGITVPDTARPSSETPCAQSEVGSDKASNAANTQAVLIKLVSDFMNGASVQASRRLGGGSRALWNEIDAGSDEGK